MRSVVKLIKVVRATMTLCYFHQSNLEHAITSTDTASHPPAH